MVVIQLKPIKKIKKSRKKIFFNKIQGKIKRILKRDFFFDKI